MEPLLLLRNNFQCLVIIACPVSDNHLHLILGFGFIFPCEPFSSGRVLEAVCSAAAPLHKTWVEWWIKMHVKTRWNRGLLTPTLRGGDAGVLVLGGWCRNVRSGCIELHLLLSNNDNANKCTCTEQKCKVMSSYLSIRSTLLFCVFLPPPPLFGSGCSIREIFPVFWLWYLQMQNHKSWEDAEKILQAE